MKISLFKDFKNLIHLINLLLYKKRKHNDENLNKIHFITNRRYFPTGGAGGGGAVQSANKILFGNELNSIPLKYSFYEENEFNLKRKNDLWDLWGAIEFVFQKTKNEQNYAYITHDYGSAMGLALLGKKYVLVSHIQGSRVEEKINFGEKFTYISRLIIQLCEKIAFKNAFAVCFPSEGAYKYFCNSKYKTIKNNEFNFGGVLYNTLYAYPEPAIVENISKDESKITFLSVGQLTIAKGMDKHASFLDGILSKTTKNIRYIFVGKGPLESSIVADLDKLKNKYLNFEYIQVKGCTYPQMQYLQDISDVYLMLHRISIFDLTTLELMNKSKCVILSDVGGNPEFSKEENIILVGENQKAAIEMLLNSDIKLLGIKNKEVYDKYFSNDKFRENYFKITRKLIGE